MKKLVEDNVNKDLTSIKDVIMKLVKSRSKKRLPQEQKIISIYKELNDLTINKNSKIRDIKNGILFLKANEPIIAQKIMMKKKAIINLINSKLEADLIKDIRIQISTIKDDYDDISNDENLINTNVEKGEYEKVKNIVKDVDDDILKRKLSRLFITSMKIKNEKTN